MTDLFCPCKINLNLIVGPREADGYHSLDSFFIPLSEPADILRVRTTSEGGFRLRCAAPLKGENILYKAYNKFCDATGSRPNVDAELIKNIPVGAGLGGGSSDAACFLEWLNNERGRPLAMDALVAAARAVGSDVPFFLRRSPGRVRGKGEIFEPAPLKWKSLFAVVVWPDFSVDTAWAYSVLDESRARALGENGLTKAGEENKKLALSSNAGIGGIDPFRYRNDLEAPVFEAYPRLAELKENLYVLKAFYAAMSGAGSAVYGLFTDAGLAGRAREALARRFSRVYLASPVGM